MPRRRCQGVVGTAILENRTPKTTPGKGAAGPGSAPPAQVHKRVIPKRVIHKRVIPKRVIQPGPALWDGGGADRRQKPKPAGLAGDGRWQPRLK